jgi:hypothetical protein
MKEAKVFYKGKDVTKIKTPFGNLILFGINREQLFNDVRYELIYKQKRESLERISFFVYGADIEVKT